MDLERAVDLAESLQVTRTQVSNQTYLLQEAAAVVLHSTGNVAQGRGTGQVPRCVLREHAEVSTTSEPSTTAIMANTCYSDSGILQPGT